MRGRVVVFPIRGRNWCFTRPIEDSISSSSSSHSPSTLKSLWNRAKSNPNPQILIDFIANKMNTAWIGLEKAPQGSFKNKIYGIGLRLLSRVNPSEIFLKSISNDLTALHVTYPSSLNPRLVRRRLRHIATRGSVVHKRYFYGSVSLLPVSGAFSILPLPNIPFFWILFRTYSHWRALAGSRRLVQLTSESSEKKEQLNGRGEIAQKRSHDSPWVLKASEELEKLVLCGKDSEDGGLSESGIKEVCERFGLNANDVLKYRNSL